MTDIDWLTCPMCLAYGEHLILDEETVDCYECRYVDVRAPGLAPTIAPGD